MHYTSTFLIFLAIMFVSSGCAISTDARRCQELRNKGIIYSTQDSCIQCVKNMGTENVDAIKGCSMGMDASKLLNMNRIGR